MRTKKSASSRDLNMPSGNISPELEFNLTGSFDEDLARYKSNQSAESYLAMRREYPDRNIPAIRFSGIDALFAIAPDLEKFGIDPCLVEGAMRSLDSDVDKLSLLLLEKVVEIRKVKVRKSMTQAPIGAIPFALVDYLIVVMLEGIEWADAPDVYPALTMLIRERLGGKDMAYYQAEQKKNHRDWAVQIGGAMLQRGIIPTYRNVANIMDVQASSVKRWFPENDFQEKCQAWKQVLESSIIQDVQEFTRIWREGREAAWE